MPQPTVQDILAMQPGPQLDRMVHSVALGRPGRAPLYSTKPEVVVELIAQLPIGVARLPQTAEGYNPAKPFVAFSLERHQQLATWFTPTSVVAPTLPIALCKMALLFTVSPKERARPPGAVVPKIGSNLQRPPLEVMPPRITPPIPGTPAAPVVPPVAQ